MNMLRPVLATVAASEEQLDTGFLSLIGQMGPVALTVFIILILFSIISWAIIFDKWRLIKRAKAKTRQFLKLFRKSTRFSEVQKQCKPMRGSPVVGMFLAGYSELRYQLSVAQNNLSASGKARINSLEGINRALTRAQAVEINKLERSLNFLATTASASPFIGLFGTVWGVIRAFQDIGGTGSTSLATVAPGIAEALIVTAAGLFAAIPALIGYNALLNQIRILSSDMDDFSLEFISVTERSFMDAAQ